MAASGSQQNKTLLEPKSELNQLDDFKFDLTDTNSNQITQNNNANNTNNNNTFQLNQTLSSPSPNQVLILNKSALTTNGPTTITTTSLAANTKKLKTIINTKNNLNIINLNTTIPSSSSSASNTTTNNQATHTLNAILRQNDSFDNYL